MGVVYKAEDNELCSSGVMKTSSLSEGPGDSMKLQRPCADASEGPSRNIAWHMSD